MILFDKNQQFTINILYFMIFGKFNQVQKINVNNTVMGLQAW